ncbi:uncharacterized protein C8Q71DRAFT_721375 [Rhodofomes roseus]|uniref:Uncharacterized protein n=1 Tax=Rhodofomes roseus TaxID=34475 RepID=A0ABQ8KSY1_9APHY|nr:uncharacterized protein C8Q71DRAFT_721375 [Rhodofomes roseus]KAH9840941.1 hypothetical protein C8Q71DRAFT_721375 [Rhodofomes roseus]
MSDSTSLSSSTPRRSARLRRSETQVDTSHTDAMSGTARGAPDDFKTADLASSGSPDKTKIERGATAHPTQYPPKSVRTGISSNGCTRLVSLCVAGIALYILSRSDVQCYAAAYVSTLIHPLYTMLIGSDAYSLVVQPTLPVRLCTLPTATLVIPACRRVPDGVSSVTWDDYTELVGIQGSMIAGIANQTSEHLDAVVRLQAVIWKLHRTSDTLLDSVERAWMKNGSERLLSTSRNVTLLVLDLGQDVAAVARGAEDVSQAAFSAMNRIQAAASSYTGRVLYPAPRWLVAQLFQAVRDGIRSSLSPLSMQTFIATQTLLALSSDLVHLEQYTMGHCWPRPLGRAGLRKVLHPNSPDDARCRDLLLGLDLARFDIDALHSSTRAIFAILDESERRLADLEKKAETRMEVAPDFQYAGRHLAELMYHMGRMRSVKWDAAVAQLFRALVELRRTLPVIIQQFTIPTYKSPLSHTLSPQSTMFSPFWNDRDSDRVAARVVRRPGGTTLPKQRGASGKFPRGSPNADDKRLIFVAVFSAMLLLRKRGRAHLGTTSRCEVRASANSPFINSRYFRHLEVVSSHFVPTAALLVSSLNLDLTVAAMDPDVKASVVPRKFRILLAAEVEDLDLDGAESALPHKGDPCPSKQVFAQLPSGRLSGTLTLQDVIVGRGSDLEDFFKYVILGSDTRIVAFQILRTIKWTTGGRWYYAQFKTDSAFYDCLASFSEVSARQGIEQLVDHEEIKVLEGALDRLPLSSTAAKSHDALTLHHSSEDVTRGLVIFPDQNAAAYAAPALAGIVLASELRRSKSTPGERSGSLGQAPVTLNTSAAPPPSNVPRARLRLRPSSPSAHEHVRVAAKQRATSHTSAFEQVVNTRTICQDLPRRLPEHARTRLLTRDEPPRQRMLTPTAAMHAKTPDVKTRNNISGIIAGKRKGNIAFGTPPSSNAPGPAAAPPSSTHIYEAASRSGRRTFRRASKKLSLPMVEGSPVLKGGGAESSGAGDVEEAINKVGTSIIPQAVDRQQDADKSVYAEASETGEDSSMPAPPPKTGTDKPPAPENANASAASPDLQAQSHPASLAPSRPAARPRSTLFPAAADPIATRVLQQETGQPIDSLAYAREAPCARDGSLPRTADGGRPLRASDEHAERAEAFDVGCARLMIRGTEVGMGRRVR